MVEKCGREGMSLMALLANLPSWRPSVRVSYKKQ